MLSVSFPVEKLLLNVILQVVVALDQGSALRREDVGELALFHIEPGGDIDDAHLIHHLIGGLEVGGAGPAALAEELVHEEAGADGGPFAAEVPAQGFFGGVVGPDDVSGAVVVGKAFGGVHVEVDAQGLVH